MKDIAKSNTSAVADNGPLTKSYLLREKMSEVADKARMLQERLVGPSPENLSNASASPQPSCYIDHITTNIDEAIIMLELINGSLSFISNRMG